MKLIIAEKPSLARAIASAIGGVRQGGRLRLDCNDGYSVTWLAGHVLEQFQPEDYDPVFKKWNIEALPIVPLQWKKSPKVASMDLIKNAKQLLSMADEAINAGDADREGQLLVDEVLDYCGYKGPCRRLLITDMNAEAIRKSLMAMKDNKEYRTLSQSAEARSRSDWLIGLNLTRLYTIKGRMAGYDGVLSVGRVQTPTLGLVVARDKEIEDFRAVPYWELEGTFKGASCIYKGKWTPASTDGPGFDAEGRMADEKIMKRLVASLEGKSGHVTSAVTKERIEHPPLPHSLPTLQMECNKRFGMSPADTLAVLQGLYEAKVATYPRSDCRYLPVSLHANAGEVFRAVSEMVPEYEPLCEKADKHLKTAAWDDSKVTEHFAIIPTGVSKQLTDKEKKVMDAISLAYIRNFLGDYKYNQTEIITMVGQEAFKTTGASPVKMGWKITVEKEDKVPALPQVKKGEITEVVKLDMQAKETVPPKRFTEATLLKAMNSIHLYVKDPAIRAALKAADGIGTAATQAGIIETLFKRGFMEKKGKNIISTKTGRELITVVGKGLASPDFTALMENGLEEIRTGAKTFDGYMEWMAKMTGEMVSEGKGAEMATRAGTEKCFKCGSPLRKLNGKFGAFWACSNPDCKATFNDRGGRPEPRKERVPLSSEKCFKCGSPLRKLNGKFGAFWACSNPDCKATFNDMDGKPTQHKEPRPLSSEKCPKCGSPLRKLNGRFGVFWACSNQDCKATFNDKDGKPDPVKGGKGKWTH